ncbi:hypothetical protein HD554DRAFT_2175164 [Boletus coccyginus]|nr:hypothetical protein HD554DRAFT_2175164 [Boletus coccyginus]
MGIAQTQKAEEDLHVLLPNNPFVPPKGDVCFINNLPPELLSRIFEVGDGEDEDDMGADEMNEVLEAGDGDGDEDETDSGATGSSGFDTWPPFRIVVSHVCRHWRNIAFSTPSLWTTISVPAEERPPYEFASTLLERSKGLPIDIYIDCEPREYDCDVEPPSDADVEFLFSLLIPHIHRWRTMELAVLEYHHMYIFLSAVSDPSTPAAPQLETLELYHREEMEEFESFGYHSMSKHFTLFGGSAPSLTRLVLWGVHVDWNQPWIATASNLTDLELAYHPEDVRPSWAQFTSILRGASALEKLSLRISGPLGDPPEWVIARTCGSPADLNAPIQLPRVTDFILASHSQETAIGLFRKLYLPALKNLVLGFDGDDYTELVHELAGPATSSSLSSAKEQPCSLLNQLDSLKITGLPCSTESIRTLYGELQNLASLNISLSYLHPLFLDILFPCRLPGHSDVWLPRLVTLYVSGTSGKQVRELVQQRRDAGVPLSSLYVEESCEVFKKDEVWFKENLKTFEYFEGSEDEDDIVDFRDLDEGIDEWSDMD